MKPLGSLRFSNIPAKKTHGLHWLSADNVMPAPQHVASRAFIADVNTAYRLTESFTLPGSPPSLRNQYQTRACNATWSNATKAATPIIRVHPSPRKSEYALRLPPRRAKQASSVSRWLEMSVVSKRVEYDASLDQICQKTAKYARMGRSTVARSWMASPTLLKEVTVTMSANVMNE